MCELYGSYGDDVDSDDDLCKQPGCQDIGFIEYMLAQDPHWREENDDEAKDDTKAFQLLIQAAEEGHAPSQFKLGEMYRRGKGVSTQDNAIAFQWYCKAANQNHARAQYRLGIMYEHGVGVPTQDDATAVQWYRKAANQRGYIVLVRQVE